MSLYTRLMGLDVPKISVHGFMAAMQEYMLGNMSAAQATTAFGLSGAETTEATALRDKILLETNASAPLQSAMRRIKAQEIEYVLLLAEEKKVPYNTEALVKTRLGV